MYKRVINFLLILILAGYGLTAYGITAVDAVSRANQDALTAVNLSEYVNGEVFVSYTDGSFEVMSFDSQAELSLGLEAPAQDESVTLIQPNDTYENNTLFTADCLSVQQWALSNDGSFIMEEEKNRLPVYGLPFRLPASPGQWTMPGYFGRPGGRQGMIHGVLPC